MKFEPTRLAEYTDEAILTEIRRVADMINQPLLSITVFNAHARVGRTTVKRRFDDWCEALDAAGLGHLYNEIAPARVPLTRAHRWTKEQIIEELNRVAALIGRESITVDDFHQHAVIGPDSVRSRFGGWPQALRAVGLKPVNHGRRYSDEECLENLLSVWTHYGRPPKYQEMNQTPSSVGGKAYMKRY